MNLPFLRSARERSATPAILQNARERSATSLNRRRFLTAVGATALTYPLLRALPSYAGGANKYLILVFTPNGVVRNCWGAAPVSGTVPASGVSTTNFTLRSWLTPLAKYQSQMVIVRGLANKAAGTGDPHGPGMASLWTGQTVANQNQSPGGPSIDQAIAAALKAPTPQSSIAFRAVSPQDYEGKSIYNRMIYDSMGNMVDPYDTPTATLSELFLGVGADAGAADAGPNPQVALRQRVIQRLNGELGRVMPKLCNEDRAQLDALQSGLNTLNSNIGATGTGALSVCGQPMVSGGPTYPQIVEDTINLVTMAVACDLSRVMSLQFSQALSPMVPDFLSYMGSPITTDHHTLSHQAPHRFQVGPNAPVTSDADDVSAAQIAACQPAIGELTAIYQWYATQIAALCDALAAIPAGNGKTLFDQTIICWGNELDNGSDHDHWELPLLLLGGGGGSIKTGQMVEYPIYNGYSLQPSDISMAARAHNDLHVTLAKAMGVNMTTFGPAAYNVGPLTEVLA